MYFLQKFFFGDRRDINKNSYVWNMLAGILSAARSVCILMVLTRVCGIDDAGMFTIAYASANLFLTIGSYGMRNYQVTDIRNVYSFSDYFYSRVITSFMMMVVCVTYIFNGINVHGYSLEKAWIIFVVCLFKMIDGFEDVFLGLYQRKGRLDVGSKILSIRLIISILMICSCIVITKNLLLSLVISTAITALVSIIFNLSVFKKFNIRSWKLSVKNSFTLLVECFGPFIGAFLSFYIVEAPKYAIDAYLPQKMQAYYGFISMPIFFVGLLNGFLYQPILTYLAHDWTSRKIKKFVMRILKQIAIIISLTIITMLGGYVLGVPILSLLYHADLSPYKAELLILLLGGGMFAIVGFINIALTILRNQRDLIWGYLIIAIVAYILSPLFVRSYGIMGAATVYTLLISGLVLIFSVVLVYRIKTNR